MLIALNKQNRYVHASSIEKDGGEYVCPGCHEPVYLKRGAIRMPHFSHYRQSECRVFSEGETVEHMKGKQLLYEWLFRARIPVQLEAYLPALSQRPDVLCWLPDGTPLAIEFQCSRLPVERMKERTNGYQKNGYRVIWIVGKEFFLHRSFTPFQKLFLYETQNNTVIFPQMDVEKKILQVAYDFTLRPGTKSVEYKKKEISLTNPIPHAANQFVTEKRNLLPVNLPALQEKLYQKRFYKDKEVLCFLHEIYREGDNLVTLPIETYLPVEGEWMVETLSFRWKYALLKWLETKPIGTVFCEKEVEQVIQKMIQSNQLTFCDSPLINKRTFFLPIQRFLRLLCMKGVIAQISQSEWVINVFPLHFKNEESKTRALRLMS